MRVVIFLIKFDGVYCVFFLDLENFVEKEDFIFKFIKVYLVFIIIFNLLFILVLMELDFDNRIRDSEGFI